MKPLSKKKRLQEKNVFSKSDPKKILCSSSSFNVKEAYNSIRTNLLFIQQGEKCPVSFAQMGKKTLLIDSDMRNPTMHRMFSIPVKNGLSEILAGMTDNISVSKTGIENLSVLTAGKIPPNPAELLSSNRMDKLLDFVREHYDCVFIDTPPINIVTDSTLFAQKVTGYILIVKADTTNITDVKTTVSNLEQIEANILGFVLNDINSDKKKYYSYYRKYNYNYKYSYGYKK